MQPEQMPYRVAAYQMADLLGGVFHVIHLALTSDDGLQCGFRAQYKVSGVLRRRDCEAKGAVCQGDQGFTRSLAIIRGYAGYRHQGTAGEGHMSERGRLDCPILEPDRL